MEKEQFNKLIRETERKREEKKIQEIKDLKEEFGVVFDAAKLVEEGKAILEWSVDKEGNKEKKVFLKNPDGTKGETIYYKNYKKLEPDEFDSELFSEKDNA